MEYLEKIKEEITNGNTYEVNYTYDRHVDCEADEFELFNFLLKKQATPYNAFIKNDIETIFSFSPQIMSNKCPFEIGDCKYL